MMRNCSGRPGVSEHLPAPASPHGAKGVESGSWWDCSRGKAAGQTCRWVNARLPEPRPERIDDHSPAPTSGERKGREGDELKKEQSAPPAALPTLCHKQCSWQDANPNSASRRGGGLHTHPSRTTSKHQVQGSTVPATPHGNTQREATARACLPK